MEPHSVAMEHSDIAFGQKSGDQTPASTAVPTVTFDEATADIELCRMAALGNLAALK